MTWIFRSSLIGFLTHPLLIHLIFLGQISARVTKATISFIRLGVSYCRTTQWVKQKKKEGRNGCWDWRLGGKCWRWAEVKEPGAETRSQEREKRRTVRRKEERCNRNERALLLLIIGVMRQHSLRGFPPEGMIPWGLRHWNHITAPPQTLAHFLRLLMAKEEGSGHLSALFRPFSWRHSCRFRCATTLKGFVSEEYSVWDLIWLTTERTLQISTVFAQDGLKCHHVAHNVSLRWSMDWKDMLQRDALQMGLSQDATKTRNIWFFFFFQRVVLILVQY